MKGCIYMAEFYFTFGSSKQFPYHGGWVKVMADNIYDAREKFKAHYPNRTPGSLNCADNYNSGQFWATGLQETGNLGAKCHEVII